MAKPLKMNKKFRKIAIANRGEIALRIIRAAKAIQIETLAFYSDDEKNAPHVEQADEGCSLGKGELKDTYLNVEKIVALAIENGAEAIHPGYGFLSENAAFAQACQDAGLVFIGPSVEVLQQMGNKVTAKTIARKAGVNVLESFVVDASGAFELNGIFHYPLLIKAANGGGGKGMQVVYNAEELQQKAGEAARAALNYFGSEEIYIENYIEDARHIEVQILGDAFGNIVHLHERDCTLQRKHQKIIEEAPATSISLQLRQKLHEAALAICREVGYQNAGTVEFLVDWDENFYFLEMNPRIQVEHPVTEAITGVDIVKEQLSIAAGNPLSFSQDEIRINGHAIEARVYAEDPLNGFAPSGKPVLHFEMPGDTNIRIETAIDLRGGAAQYDPLLCKLIAWGENREKAREKLISALDETTFLGTETNLQYLTALLETPEYIENKLNTQFCQLNIDALLLQIQQKNELTGHQWLLAAALFAWYGIAKETASVWLRSGFWRLYATTDILLNGQSYFIRFNIKKNMLDFHFKEKKYSFYLKEINLEKRKLLFENEGTSKSISFFKTQNAKLLLGLNGAVFELQNSSLLDFYPDDFFKENDDEMPGSEVINSHLFGRVVDIRVKSNQTIRKGDVLMIIESMKSENRVLSPRDAKIKKINVVVGEQVTDKMPLLYLENL